MKFPMATKKRQETKEQFEKRVKWFRDAGLGMFIHWGPYSKLGRGEWAMWREDIHPLDYEKIANKFDPKSFDADKWANLAKNMGAKYVVLTTRHHDGYCLWDSKTTDFTSVQRAPKRDFVAEYVKALRKQGLKVGLYYSLLDWSWPAFNMDLPMDDDFAWQKFVEEGPSYNPQAWKTFVKYVHTQVEELMTHYGKIDVLFYDGGWYQAEKQWQSNKLNAMVRKHQPGIMINDRAMVFEDFTTPENEIPVHLEHRDEPWEVCYCVNDTWGHIPSDINYKSIRQCIYALVRVRSAGGNLVLNAEPNGNGAMTAAFIKTMQGLGKWVKKNADSIYGCRLAAMAEHSTGFFSQPGMVTANPAQSKAYYHILRWLGGDNHCVKIEADIISAQFLVSGKKVEFVRKGRMIYFYNLPSKAPDPIDTVIELKYKKGSEIIKWKRSYV